MLLQAQNRILIFAFFGSNTHNQIVSISIVNVTHNSIVANIHTHRLIRKYTNKHDVKALKIRDNARTGASSLGVFSNDSTQMLALLNLSKVLDKFGKTILH